MDDDPHIRELAKVFLQNEEAGFTVYEASDGVNALSMLDAVSVDTAILDIMMPKIMAGNSAANSAPIMTSRC